jgi:hypothetical protein
VCGCRSKRRWFDGLVDAIGNAVGNLKFGGN